MIHHRSTPPFSFSMFWFCSTASSILVLPMGAARMYFIQAHLCSTDKEHTCTICESAWKCASCGSTHVLPVGTQGAQMCYARGHTCVVHESTAELCVIDTSLCLLCTVHEKIKQKTQKKPEKSKLKQEKLERNHVAFFIPTQPLAFCMDAPKARHVATLKHFPHSCK